jgi:hypothetical protein
MEVPSELVLYAFVEMTPTPTEDNGTLIYTPTFIISDPSGNGLYERLDANWKQEATILVQALGEYAEKQGAGGSTAVKICRDAPAGYQVPALNSVRPLTEEEYENVLKAIRLGVSQPEEQKQKEEVPPEVTYFFERYLS